MDLFYDLETSGLEPCWDVPLQAAFLQADAKLAMQRELTLRCRLPTHIVPSPDALLITGVTPEMLDDQPLSDIEMMAQIARIVAECKPAMLIGYNTIRFDDESAEKQARSIKYQIATGVLASTARHLSPAG